MEFIKAEDFLKQPVEIQKVFLEWFEQEITAFDLIGYIGKSPAYQKSFPHTANNVALDCFEMGKEIIPLFTVEQTRQFIEDKTGCEVVEILSNPEYGEYDASLYKTMYSQATEKEYYKLGNNRLKAYWTVAIETAKEVKR